MATFSVKSTVTWESTEEEIIDSSTVGQLRPAFNEAPTITGMPDVFRTLTGIGAIQTMPVVVTINNKKRIFSNNVQITAIVNVENTASSPNTITLSVVRGFCCKDERPTSIELSARTPASGPVKGQLTGGGIFTGTSPNTVFYLILQATESASTVVDNGFSISFKAEALVN